ncbi:MAG TPA: YggT family protein [Candidatus Tumulicola sp.]|jgi:YggT family protein
MNGGMCTFWQIADKIVFAYIAILFAYAVISWFPNVRGRWVDVLASVVEPVIRPFRRIIPPIGGLDISFLVVFLLLQVVVRQLIFRAMMNACSPF